MASAVQNPRELTSGPHSSIESTFTHRVTSALPRLFFKSSKEVLLLDSGSHLSSLLLLGSKRSKRGG